MSKFASLSAGLLARKGEAEPAATPFAEQMLTRVGAPAAEIRELTPLPHPVHLHVEPGMTVKQQGLKAVESGDKFTSVFGTIGRRAARAQLDQIKPPVAPILPTASDEDEAGESQCGGCAGPSVDEAAKTFHVNLRLKRQRFVKLKLSAALLRRPVQEIVSEALDQWFEKLPGDVLGDCACLKARGD